MPLVEWSDVFAIHVDEMDEEHKKFVAMINELHEALSNSHVMEKFVVIMDELIDFANVHFTNEEKLLETYGYPEFENQKQQHLMFRTTIIEVRKKYFAGQIVSAIDLLNYLKTWLIDHIMYEDKKYGEFINEKYKEGKNK